MGIPNIDIEALTPAERLDLLEQLWNSLAASQDSLPLTSAQREELDRRLDDLEHAGPVGATWDETLAYARRQGQ